jgi:acyl-CoA thioesterase
VTTTENLFDAGTAIEPVGRGRYRGSVDEAWWIDKGPNGGYLASIILRALSLEVDDEARTPRSFTVHYVARPTEGIVEVAAVLERVGRSTTATTARLYQDGVLLATAQAAFSIARSGPAFDDFPAPSVTPPEDIPELDVPKEVFPRFAWNFDYRWAVGGLPYSGTDRALTGGWIRLKEPRPVDPLLLVTYSDGWPPAIFSKLDAPSGVPTIDLTVHFRGSGDVQPADWSLAMFETKSASAGYIEEDGYIWSRDGILLAQSRQLALYQDPAEVHLTQ